MYSREIAPHGRRAVVPVSWSPVTQPVVPPVRAMCGAIASSHPMDSDALATVAGVQSLRKLTLVGGPGAEPPEKFGTFLVCEFTRFYLKIAAGSWAPGAGPPRPDSCAKPCGCVQNTRPHGKPDCRCTSLYGDRETPAKAHSWICDFAVAPGLPLSRSKIHAAMPTSALICQRQS